MPAVFTSNQETDARTAMTRGLKEYLEQLTSESSSGQELIFKNVFEVWAEPEDEADYPSAAVTADADAVYDLSKLTPNVALQNAVPGEPNVYVVSATEMVLDMKVGIMATNPEMRMWLVALLEQYLLNPVDWRYGILLDLPHYFGQRASYEMMSMSYVDSETTAQQRLRNAVFQMRGRIAVCRLFKRPPTTIRTRVEVIE